jgi:hypothetical protein
MEEACSGCAGNAQGCAQAYSCGRLSMASDAPQEDVGEQSVVRSPLPTSPEANLP